MKRIEETQIVIVQKAVEELNEAKMRLVSAINTDNKEVIDSTLTIIDAVIRYLFKKGESYEVMFID